MNEAVHASIATTLSLGRDRTYSPVRRKRTIPSSTVATAPREAVAATTEVSVATPLVPTNYHVYKTPPSVWTTAAVTSAAGMMPHGIAGTALSSLFEARQMQLPPLQYQIQHKQQQQSTAWQSFTLLQSPPFSFNTSLPTFKWNKAITKHGLHQMQYVLDAIPLLHRMEYTVAGNLVPHLMQVESDPAHFLRYTNWDVQAAAHKLIAYWKCWVAIFGQERVYLPLMLWLSSSERMGSESWPTANYESALSKENMAFIE